MKTIRNTIGLTLLAGIITMMLSGCATSRSAGVTAAIRSMDSIETIAENHRIYRLADYDGVALLTLGKIGALGLGAFGATATVYVRDPDTNEFGSPAFLHYGGPSIGLGYVGLNGVNCLLLFRSREDAMKFSKKQFFCNFSNEASFAVWGRKQMTIPRADSYSDGALLALGFIELELFMGGPRSSLHRNLYGTHATTDQILSGDVSTPKEIEPALQKLNVRMKQ